MAEVAETKKPALHRLLENQMKAAEYVRQDLVVTPEKGTTLKEMLDPAYWTHVAKKLRPYDRIEVRPIDQTWWAILLVTAVVAFSAKVIVLEEVALNVRSIAGASRTTVEVPEGYIVDHRGAKGWVVERTDDKVLVVEGKGSRDEALLSLGIYLEKIAA